MALTNTTQGNTSIHSLGNDTRTDHMRRVAYVDTRMRTIDDLAPLCPAYATCMALAQTGIVRRYAMEELVEQVNHILGINGRRLIDASEGRLFYALELHFLAIARA